MQTTRARAWIVTVALIAALAACGDKKKKEEGGAGGAAVAQAPVDADLKAMLAVLPVTSDAVFGADLVKLRGSELYKSYEKTIEGAIQKRLEVIRTVCGFDPMTKVTEVVGSGTISREGDLTAVVKGLSKSETMACMQKAVTTPPATARVEVDGDYVRVEQVREVKAAEAKPAPPADKKKAPTAGAGTGTGTGTGTAAPTTATEPGSAVSLQFIDENTVVIARRKGDAVDKATMARVVAGDPAQSIAGSAGFMGLLDGIDTEAPVWLVLAATDNVRSAARGFADSLDQAIVQLYPGAGLRLDATLRMKNKADAEQFAKTAERQITSLRKSTLKKALPEVKIDHTGQDVRLRTEASREQLQELSSLAGIFLMGYFERDE